MVSVTLKFNVKTEDAGHVVAVFKCVWEGNIETAIYLPTSCSLLLKRKSKFVKELTTFETLVSLLVKHEQNSYKKHVYMNFNSLNAKVAII